MGERERVSKRESQKKREKDSLREPEKEKVSERERAKKRRRAQESQRERVREGRERDFLTSLKVSHRERVPEREIYVERALDGVTCIYPVYIY